MGSIEEFVAQLPKVELHVHLVGSAPLSTVLKLARRHPGAPDGPGARVPRTEEGLRAFYTFRDFPHFIDVYTAVSALLTEPEDIADLVRGIAAELAAQNVRYVELQAAPYSFRRAGMPAGVITEALDAGARDALSEHGVRIGYIFDFAGQRADVHALPTIEHALSQPPEALMPTRGSWRTCGSGSFPSTSHRPPTCEPGRWPRLPGTRCPRCSPRGCT